LKSTFVRVTFEGKFSLIPNLFRDLQYYEKMKTLKQVQGEFMLKINEIYHSIQGESTSAGRPCVFVRLTYCNLRCTYCDTEYAFYDGKEFRIVSSGLGLNSSITGIVQTANNDYLIASLNNGLILLDKNLSNGKKIEGIQVDEQQVAEHLAASVRCNEAESGSWTPAYM